LPIFVGDICCWQITVADKNFCWRPVNQNTPSGRMLGGWAWLTSVIRAVIGRPSKSDGLQVSVMLATLVAFVGNCEQAV